MKLQKRFRYIFYKCRNNCYSHHSSICNASFFSKLISFLGKGAQKHRISNTSLWTAQSRSTRSVCDFCESSNWLQSCHLKQSRVKPLALVHNYDICRYMTLLSLKYDALIVMQSRRISLPIPIQKRKHRYLNQITLYNKPLSIFRNF